MRKTSIGPYPRRATVRYLPGVAVEPTGHRVMATATTGATFRYRVGVPVEIWHRPDAFGPGIYQVFIAGRLTGGWGTQDLATTYAAQF